MYIFRFLASAGAVGTQKTALLILVEIVESQILPILLVHYPCSGCEP
jgi:hypothetical protein